MMTHCDVVVHRGNSVLQHGKINNRVYIMKLAREDIPDIIRYADELTHKEGYTKIFVKVPESSVDVFTEAGYAAEATIPLFYNGSDTAVFMAKYTDPKRKDVPDATVIAEVLSAAFGYAGERSPDKLMEGFSLMHAHSGDAKEIAALYQSVFKTYPFPIYDPEYIRESMQGQVRYFIIKKSHQLTAVASFEFNADSKTAEMTDFATDPQFRGRGFALNLLHVMETEVKKEGGLLAYTITRAISKPINTTFAGSG
ncbi:MAG: putative beta-lysine N-acetyltransferase, partial [Methanoregulaceae archaeon]|nr:putative beta-lysine N-acetyltransferase [Methanoregulaceae archaeon]